MSRLSLSLVVAVLAASSVARADGLVLTQQGYLLDANDAPVENASQDVSFRFFATSVHADGETAFWDSGTCQIRVSKGRYVVLLGGAGSDGGCGQPIQPSALPPESPRYLEISVGGVTLAPRLRLGSVPNAGFASRALVADRSLDTETLASALKDAHGTLNAAANPVHWSQLTGVPAAFADGTDDGNTYAADEQTLALLDGKFGVKAGGIGNAQLASDGASLAKVSGGALSASGQGISASGVITAGGFAGDGHALTNLPASAIVGTIPTSNLPSNLVAGNFAGDVTVGGTLSVTGATTLSNALTIGGATTLSSTLAVSGATTLSSLSVTGAANLNGGLALPANGLSVGANQLVVSGGNTGVGVSSPSAKLDVAGEIKVGNTGASCGATTAGAVRFNTTTKMLEFCNGTTWYPTNVDDQPDPLGFTSVIGALGAIVTSNTVTPTSFSAPIPVSVSGGGSPALKVNNGAYVTSATLSPGDTLTLRATASATPGTAVTVTVNAGSGVFTWVVTAGYNNQYVKTVDAGGTTYNVAIALNSTDSCNTTCSNRGLTCNTVSLQNLQTWAKQGTNMRDLLQNKLGLTFSQSGWTPNMYTGYDSYFGIGCSSGTWNFTGFGSQITSCGSPNVDYDANLMSCTSSGYNSGLYSGPRICTCQ